MLATRALQVFDDTVSVVRVVTRWVEFYQHESCGKCTPCREGTYWMRQIMARLEAGRGLPGDVEKLEDIASNISGRSFCALGDASAVTVTNVFFILTNRQKISKSLVASQILNLHKQKELFTVVCEGDIIREAALNYCIQNDADYEDALQYFCALKHNCKEIGRAHV